VPRATRRRKKKENPASAEDLRAILKNAREQFVQGGGEMKVSVADFIRLMQLYRELEADEPKEIVVRWVESPASPGK